MIWEGEKEGGQGERERGKEGGREGGRRGGREEEMWGGGQKETREVKEGVRAERG